MSLPAHPRERAFWGDVFALAGLALLELDRAGLDVARADDELPGQSDQVHRRGFRAGAVLGVVVEGLDLGGGERRVESIGKRPRLLVARPERDEPDFERRHRFRPDAAVLVVARLDDAADEA